MADVVALDDLEFSRLVRPGETVTWGQACAEPQSLTERLMAQRAAIGNFTVFVGASYSATPDPRYTDHVRFVSYAGTGTNRALAKAGKIDIFPRNYPLDTRTKAHDIIAGCCGRCHHREDSSRWAIACLGIQSGRYLSRSWLRAFGPVSSKLECR